MGVTKFDDVNWTTYNINNSRISDNGVNSISFDEQGNVWFATNSGIAELLNTDTAFAVWVQSNSNVCISDTITLSSATNSGKTPFSYLWQGIGDSLSCDTCQNPTAVITTVATFIVQVTDSTGLTVSDTLVVHPCYPTGISQIAGDSAYLTLYPNPFNNKITVSLQTQNAKQATFSIYNMMGEMVYSDQESKISSSYTKTIDLCNLSDGVYFFQAVIDEDRIVRKIVKQ